MSRTEGDWFECVGYGWHCIRSVDEVICDMRFIGGTANEDNANLIAAAPELLEALEHVVSIRSAMIELDELVQRQIISAIAKAKGLTK